jgi:multiple sugar transport system ATP-binding protein
MAGIRVERLSKRFGNVRAVDEVTLDIADGEFIVLLGPSGCGKTTLLRMIAGLLTPTDGRILLGERDITYLPPRDRDLAMVFQSYALYPHLSVEHNIAFPLRAQGRPRAEIRQRVRTVADQLGLGQLLGRKPRELSGGQRQRVALGRALVRDPRAFLMDEPLSNLDAKLRTATRTELETLHDRTGATFVYVTHDQVEAMTMATRIVLLNAGKVEQVGTPAQVYDQPSTVFAAGFLGSPPMNLLDARIEADGVRVLARAPGVEIPLHGGDQPAREVVLGLRPEDLRQATASAASAVSGAALDVSIVEIRLDATVRTVENLGSEEIAWCEVGPALVAVRGPRPLGLHRGQHIALSADPARVHLFDRASGRRLVWCQPSVPSTTERRPVTAAA